MLQLVPFQISFRRSKIELRKRKYQRVHTILLGTIPCNLPFIPLADAVVRIVAQILGAQAKSPCLFPVAKHLIHGATITPESCPRAPHRPKIVEVIFGETLFCIVANAEAVLGPDRARAHEGVWRRQAGSLLLMRV